MRRIIAVFLALLALAAGAATPFSSDVSDLWWNPAESGWGVNLAQQSNVVFATFFVYGADGKAHWYSASDMTSPDWPGDRPMVFRGNLFESDGPAFYASPFNPSTVHRRQVGTATFEYRGQGSGTFTYTVDGTTVSKDVTRLTMAGNDPSGSYSTSMALRRFLPQCQANEGIRTWTTTDIAVVNGAFTMTLTKGVAPPDNICRFSGQYRQSGRYGYLEAGTYTCNAGTSGSFWLRDVEVGPYGFTAALNISERGCMLVGHFGGVRVDVRNPAN